MAWHHYKGITCWRDPTGLGYNHRRMKKWHFWIGVLISVLFTWLAVRGLRLEEFWDEIKKEN